MSARNDNAVPGTEDSERCPGVVHIGQLYRIHLLINKLSLRKHIHGAGRGLPAVAGGHGDDGVSRRDRRHQAFLVHGSHFRTGAAPADGLVVGVPGKNGRGQGKGLPDVDPGLVQAQFHAGHRDGCGRNGDGTASLLATGGRCHRRHARGDRGNGAGRHGGNRRIGRGPRDRGIRSV